MVAYFISWFNLTIRFLEKSRDPGRCQETYSKLNQRRVFITTIYTGCGILTETDLFDTLLVTIIQRICFSTSIKEWDFKSYTYVEGQSTHFLSYLKSMWIFLLSDRAHSMGYITISTSQKASWCSIKLIMLW